MADYLDESYRHDGEDEDDGGTFDADKINNDHVILLVDARESMLGTMTTDGERYIDAAMKTAAYVLKTKLIASTTHRVGVTFFGTQKTSNVEENNPNVFVFQELATPSARRIRDLEDLSRGKANFEKKYGSLGEGDLCPLRSGLWSCQSEFMTIKNPSDFKRIFIFTNDDDPLKGNEDEKKRVRIVVQEIVESSIEIQLFHMRKGGEAFDPNKFYREILAGDGDDYNNEDIGQGATAIPEILKRVRHKEFKKRTLARLPFHICEGVEGKHSFTKISFDVKLYTMRYTAQKPSPIYLDARRNKPVQVISKYMDDKTGAQLDKHETRTYFEFCGERVYVTPEDIAHLKSMSPKGLVLLGFKKVGDVRPDHNLRSPYFLYPDEESVHGSMKAFVSLYTAMMNMGMYALAKLTTRDNTTPKLVALIPQKEELDEDGIQVSPPGLHAVVVPFADEVREHKPGKNDRVKVEEEEVSQEAVSAAEALIKALQLDGIDCRQFDNPMLQRHYAALEAIALSEEEISWDPEKHDATRPVDERIDILTANQMDAFKMIFGGDTEDDVPATQKKAKRPAGGSGEMNKVKKPKVEADSSDFDWKACVASGEIERLVVPNLKGYLKNHGLPTGGKKADLVDRIKHHVKTQQ